MLGAKFICKEQYINVPVDASVEVIWSSDGHVQIRYNDDYHWLPMHEFKKHFKRCNLCVRCLHVLHA